MELNGAVWATGSDGIAKKMAEVMNQTPRPVTGFTGDHMYRHIFTNTHIEVDEAAGTAKADSYFFVLHVFHGSPPTIRGGGRYHDRFVHARAAPGASPPRAWISTGRMHEQTQTKRLPP